MELYSCHDGSSDRSIHYIERHGMLFLYHRNHGDTISKRVLYHDEFRMAGADASYKDVAPGGDMSEGDRSRNEIKQ